MAQAKFQTAILKPLTSIFDCRSNVDETPPGAFRWKQNFAINPDGKLSRALGWIRPWDNICYKNWDFHNQGVAADLREPTTLMFQSSANDGTRRLFTGTKTRLLQLDEVNGVYSTIGTGFGADGEDSLTQVRFNASELQNHVVFTNNFDIPQIHVLASGTVAPIAALATAGEGNVAITKARRTVAWKGVVFLMNTVEDGVRISSRIRWCDLNDATKWKPGEITAGTLSLADYQDLDYGEVILNAMPMGNFLWVFTDRSIWKCNFDVDVTDPLNPTAVLNCVKVYTEPRNRAKCLAYENSLVSTGFSFYYMASDGIYEFNQYLAEPDRIEWLHRSTAVIYKDSATRIDKQACMSPVAEYVPGPNEDETAGSGEIHFSWPVYDPIAIDTGGGTGEIDCESYHPTPPPIGSGINQHTLVANVKFKTADYRNYGTTAMTNFTSSVLASSGCNQQSVFLAANGQDFCIKQMNTGSGRVMYDVGAGGYETVGYFATVRGVFPFERFNFEKIIESFLVGVLADDPADAAVLALRIGTSYEALDPNVLNDRCGVLWHTLSKKPIRCRNSFTPTEYVEKNVRPDDPLDWRFLYQGKFLYYELKITKPDGTAPISGACSISRFEVSVKQAA